MFRIDADGHVNNRFSNGDPVTGQPGTVIAADWLNAVQEELCTIITGAGLVLNKFSHSQLWTAVLALINGRASALISEHEHDRRAHRDLVARAYATVRMVNGTPIVDNDSNLTFAERVSENELRLDFETALPNTTYAVIATLGECDVATVARMAQRQKETGSFRLRALASDGSAVDISYANLTVDVAVFCTG